MLGKSKKANKFSLAKQGATFKIGNKKLSKTKQGTEHT